MFIPTFMKCVMFCCWLSSKTIRFWELSPINPSHLKINLLPKIMHFCSTLQMKNVFPTTSPTIPSPIIRNVWYGDTTKSWLSLPSLKSCTVASVELKTYFGTSNTHLKISSIPTNNGPESRDSNSIKSSKYDQYIIIQVPSIFFIIFLKLMFWPAWKLWFWKLVKILGTVFGNAVIFLYKVVK